MPGAETIGGVAIAAVSTRSPERRMIALRQANRVRCARAKLKQDLRAGKVRLEHVLATPADYLASAEVFDLLVAVPKIGPVKASRLAAGRIRPSKTVGDLSERQRTHLIELLSSELVPTLGRYSGTLCPGDGSRPSLGLRVDPEFAELVVNEPTQIAPVRE